MKKCTLMALLCSLFALPTFAGTEKIETKTMFDCSSAGNSPAQLTYTKDGVYWYESKTFAGSAGKPNSSEEAGDLYTLIDFYHTENDGYELRVSRQLADGRVEGTVAVLYDGAPEAVYNCK
jgi:hypothetical protein